MYVLKRSSRWAGSFIAALAVLLLGAVFVSPPAYAKGEYYQYVPGDNSIRVTGETIVGAGGLFDPDGDNVYEGVINVPGKIARNPTGDPLPDTPCPQKIFVTVPGDTVEDGEVGSVSFENPAFSNTTPGECKSGSSVNAADINDIFDEQATIRYAPSPADTPPTCPEGYTPNTVNCIAPPGPNNTCPGGGTFVPAVPGPGGGEAARCELPLTPGAGAAPTPEEEVKCTAESALSWILCPILDIAVKGISVVSGLIEGLLKVNPLTTDQGNGVIYEVWSNLRNFANILFIFVMFAIIYSQATSMGMSAYGVKRILPKLIAAAILANLSYFICAIAIDIFNVLGAGVASLLTSALQVPVGSQTGGAGGTQGDGLFAGIFGNVLAFGAAVGIAVIALVFFWSTMLLVVLVVLFTLAARQALIIVLVILAPVAFALWVLPNTEKYYKKWFELFLSLLIMYPLVMVLFAGSRVAASVLGASGDSLQQTIAIFVAVVPLVALPALFKVGSYSLGKVTQMARGSKIGQGFEGFAQRGRQSAAARMAGNELGKNRGGISGAVLKGVGKGARFTGGYNARRKDKQNTRTRNAERAQQAAIAAIAGETEADGVTPTKQAARYSKSAAGVAGDKGAATVRAQARSQTRKLDLESINSLVDDLSARFGNDANAIEAQFRDKTNLSNVEVEAVFEKLLKSGGPGLAAARKLSTNGNFMGQVGQEGKTYADSVVESSRRNFNVLDDKAPDMASWASTFNAAQTMPAGADFNWDNVGSNKLLKLDPAAAAAARAAFDVDPSRGINAQEALRALASSDAVGIKPKTREVLEHAVTSAGLAVPDAAGNIPSTTQPPPATPAPAASAASRFNNARAASAAANNPPAPTPAPPNPGPRPGPSGPGGTP